MRSASATTANTTSTVTQSTESSWNSFQAPTYQAVVQPPGSQVPSQRLANELVATAAIMNAMLTTNKVIRPSSSPRHARSNHALATLRFITRLAFPARNRAAIKQIAQAQHGGDDDQ